MLLFAIAHLHAHHPLHTLARLQMDIITPADKAKLDDKFIEMVIDGGLSFRFVENPAVKDFFAMLRPAYKLPDRRDVSVWVRERVFAGLRGVSTSAFAWHACTHTNGQHLQTSNISHLPLTFFCTTK